MEWHGLSWAHILLRSSGKITEAPVSNAVPFTGWLTSLCSQHHWYCKSGVCEWKDLRRSSHYPVISMSCGLPVFACTDHNRLWSVLWYFWTITGSTPYIKGKPAVFVSAPVAWVWNHTQLPSLPVLATVKVFDPHFNPRWGRPMPLHRKLIEEKKALRVHKPVGLFSSEQQSWHFFQVFVLLYLALHPQGRDPCPGLAWIPAHLCVVFAVSGPLTQDSRDVGLYVYSQQYVQWRHTESLSFKIRTKTSTVPSLS